MLISGFNKIEGITVDGYCITTTWRDKEDYLANIADISSSFPSNLYYLAVRPGFDKSTRITITNSISGSTIQRSVNMDEFDTLSKFTEIYTIMLRNIVSQEYSPF